MKTSMENQSPASSAGPGTRFRFLYVQCALFVVLSCLLRAVLSWKFHPPAGVSGVDAAGWLRVASVGLLFDLAVAFGVFTPAALWLGLARGNWLERRWHRNLLLGATGFLWGLLLFLFVGEYFFFEEYASRFNTVAIDYLHYWTEVSGNIGQMYPWKKIVTLCISGAFLIPWLLRRLEWPESQVEFPRRARALGVWLVLTAVLAGAASRVSPQASSERVMNELASNGLASGLVALWTREFDYAHFYPTLPREEAYSRARRLLDSNGAEWSKDSFSLQRRIPGSPDRPRLNVVILVQESFGSEFWGCLNLKDGKPEKRTLTPALDAIAAKEGLLFTNLLADGNRTVRGLEAILASFPPLPGDAILGRTKSEGCDTLATVLARDGYSTTFMYTGRGLFDNMKPFMLKNGFQRFVEGGDFKSPTFTTVWGHCDEDLYDGVIAEARTAHASGRPFFITTMSVSNHQPFKFPEGRVDPKLKGHKAGARYSDVAISRFFEQAKKEEFWKDTIFVVVADHGARVYGSQTVPMLSYEIPLLIVGPAVVKQPARIDTLGCQLDIAPTLLGLIGRPYETVFFGRDLFAPAASRFALMHHNRSIAMYQNSEMIALSLGKVVERFRRVDRKTLVREAANEATAEAAANATALFQTASELFLANRYKVEASKE